MKIRSFSTGGVSGVCFFNGCVMILHYVSMISSVCVHSSDYGSGGLNAWCQALFFEFRSCSLNFLQHISCYNLRTSSVLKNLPTLVSVSVVPSD